MEGGLDTTYYSQPYPALVKAYILHFLGQKPATLTTTSYIYVVTTTAALVFKGTVAMETKLAKMLVTAQNFIISN